MINPLYTLTMMLAVGVGVFLSRRTQRGLPLRGEEQLAVGLGAFCGAMIGAKLPFVLADWRGALSGVAWFPTVRRFFAVWSAAISAWRLPNGPAEFASKRAIRSLCQ